MGSSASPDPRATECPEALASSPQAALPPAWIVKQEWRPALACLLASREWRYGFAEPGEHDGQGTEAQRPGAEEAQGFQGCDRRTSVSVPAQASEACFDQGTVEAASGA